LSDQVGLRGVGRASAAGDGKENGRHDGEEAGG
jgi:hypothetical protein